MMKTKLTFIVLAGLFTSSHAEVLSMPQAIQKLFAGKQSSVTFEGDEAIRQALATAGGPQSRLRISITAEADLVQSGCKRILMQVRALDATVKDAKTGGSVPFETSMRSNICEDMQPPKTIEGARPK